MSLDVADVVLLLHILNLATRFVQKNIDGLMQKRCNSIALAMELHLFRIKPSIWTCQNVQECNVLIFLSSTFLGLKDILVSGVCYLSIHLPIHQSIPWCRCSTGHTIL